MVIEKELLQVEGFKILCVAEVRGELTKLNDLAEKVGASIIIHTGNFGFFDKDSVNKIHESYLRHIIAFSPLVNEELKESVNQLSKVDPSSKTDEKRIIDYVKDEVLSELHLFLTQELKFNVPVYSIHGMIEDTSVVNKFKLGIYDVPNLHLIDENNHYTINTPGGVDICLMGLGGALNISKLFFHSTYDDSIQSEISKIPKDKQEAKFFVPASGDPGNTWITLLQIGQLIKTVGSLVDSNSKKAVKIFVTHSSPSKESLLEHLAIFLKADYTISNSLHFLYSSSYNELSICPNYEFFKNKFIDSKLQLIKIWKNIKSTIELISNREDNPNKAEMSDLFEIALNCFDRIPISSSTLAPSASLVSDNKKDQQNNFKNITPLSLYSKTSLANSLAVSKHQNDDYYSAFQNLWHFNLCDFEKGHVLLDVKGGKFEMQSVSLGFDFSFRKVALDDPEDDDDEDDTESEFKDEFNEMRVEEGDSKQLEKSYRGRSSNYRGKPKTRGRGGGTIRSRGSARGRLSRGKVKE